MVSCYTVFAIYRIVPKYGRKDPLVYLSICSLVGSISVMSCKGFGIALKLTFAGNNQLTHPSTYVFIIMKLYIQINIREEATIINMHILDLLFFVCLLDKSGPFNINSLNNIFHRTYNYFHLFCILIFILNKYLNIIN